MAVIRGALGDDERGGTGQRDGRGVLWDDDILNGLDEDDRGGGLLDFPRWGGGAGKIGQAAACICS